MLFLQPKTKHIFDDLITRIYCDFNLYKNGCETGALTSYETTFIGVLVSVQIEQTRYSMLVTEFKR